MKDPKSGMARLMNPGSAH